MLAQHRVRFTDGMHAFRANSIRLTTHKMRTKKERVTVRNVERVREILQREPHSTYVQIQREVGIGSAALNRILHGELKVKKVCARWIPHSLSEVQKLNRVKWCKQMIRKFKNGRSKRTFDIVTGDETWLHFYDPKTKRDSYKLVHEDDPRPVKVRAAKSVGKRMYALFFRKSGFVAHAELQPKCTVTARWYMYACLSRMFRKLKDQRPNTGLSGILLHRDNASAHTAGKTTKFLRKRKIKMTGHPAYSPDLAPLDFYYNPKIKQQLRGIRFRDEKELRRSVKVAINSITPAEHRQCFSDWFDRMHKCIRCGGEYFEKI